MTTNARSDLYKHVRDNGGVIEWAEALGIAASSLYAKLQGRRPITPNEARIIEQKSRGRFKKERIVFG